jgi:tricarballylate dehydrogenase
MEDGGLAMRLDCVPFAVVVNRDVERFYDEGEDVWPKRYAIWGRLIAQQPGQVAFAVTDSKALHNYLPSVFPPYKANSIAELAGMAGIDAGKLEKVIADYNAAVRPGTFQPMKPDDCRTEGLSPPKSHWARLIDTPPYYCHPLKPGITFTFLGVKVSDRARIIMADGKLVTAADLDLADEASADDPINLRAVREVADRKAITRALARTEGNISGAAKLLGISRPTLYDLLKSYDIAV